LKILKALSDRLLSQHKPFHILIVDDNSPDHTADKRVKTIPTEFESRLFLKIERNLTGTAYVHGFKMGIEQWL
jgi:dolichol-phosphate mannosyltransferase